MGACRVGVTPTAKNITSVENTENLIFSIKKNLLLNCKFFFSAINIEYYFKSAFWKEYQPTKPNRAVSGIK